MVSLFYQTALVLTPSAAALGPGPLMIGIIGASMVCRPLIGKLGRLLVIIGLGITLAGAAGLWATVLAEGIAVGLWTLAPSLLVLGVGMGTCFSSIYDIAIGDIAPAEAGSASGVLSAIQQLAAAIGSAAVTTIYFSQQHSPPARANAGRLNPQPLHRLRRSRSLMPNDALPVLASAPLVQTRPSLHFSGHDRRFGLPVPVVGEQSTRAVAWVARVAWDELSSEWPVVADQLLVRGIVADALGVVHACAELHQALVRLGDQLREDGGALDDVRAGLADAGDELPAPRLRP